MTLRIDLITGFPAILEPVINESIIKKGRENEAVAIYLHNLRDFTTDKHHTIDDYPYGGGPGMVLMVGPFIKCLEKINKEASLSQAEIILMTPRGKTFTQKDATKLTLKKHLIILCGHYKGVDERLFNFYKINEISIGDYIISSGEISALVIVDAVVRLLPGVLNDIDSAWTDSFSDYLLDSPYFTRPEEFRGVKIPQVLKTGDHNKIEQWRLKQKEDITRKNRPDLYKKYLKSIK